MGRKIVVMLVCMLFFLVLFNPFGEVRAMRKPKDEANLFVLIPTENGAMRKDFTLPVEDAKALREKIGEIFKNSSTPEEAYTKILYLFREFGIDLPLPEEIERLADTGYPVYSMLCSLVFAGVGIGGYFGLSIPPSQPSPIVAGAYPLLVVAGLYYLIIPEKGGVTKLAGPDTVIAFNIPFIGILIGMQMPGSMANFPLIIGFGFSGISVWFPIS